MRLGRSPRGTLTAFTLGLRLLRFISSTGTTRSTSPETVGLLGCSAYTGMKGLSGIIAGMANPYRAGRLTEGRNYRMVVRIRFLNKISINNRWGTFNLR